MAQPSKPIPLSDQVLKTLETLSSRPGVESTLILSRKDGSVIKAKGSVEDPSPEQQDKDDVAWKTVVSPDNVEAEVGAVRSTAGSSSSQVNEKEEEEKEEEDHDKDDAAESAPQPTRAEKLAAEIFHFVTVASSLTSSMQSLLSPPLERSEPGYLSGSTAADPSQSASSNRDTEQVGQDPPHPADEVQLLRMRSKKREIVIYPDRKFLCCVIQNTERVGR